MFSDKRLLNLTASTKVRVYRPGEVRCWHRYCRELHCPLFIWKLPSIPHRSPRSNLSLEFDLVEYRTPQMWVDSYEIFYILIFLPYEFGWWLAPSSVLSATSVRWYCSSSPQYFLKLCILSIAATHFRRVAGTRRKRCGYPHMYGPPMTDWYFTVGRCS